MHALKLNRRLHLYLGLALAPWFFMYGLSGVVFNHGPFFDERAKASGLPGSTPLFDRPYQIDVPAAGDLRPLGARIMKDVGLTGDFGTYRAGPDKVNIYVYTFWRSTQVEYLVSQQRLTAKRSRFRWDHFLTGMHAKGGFEQGGLSDIWSLVVDLVVAAMLLWILTGLVMWWQLRQTRAWGWLALLSGLSLFLVLLRG